MTSCGLSMATTSSQGSSRPALVCSQLTACSVISGSECRPAPARPRKVRVVALPVAEAVGFEIRELAAGEVPLAEVGAVVALGAQRVADRRDVGFEVGAFGLADPVDVLGDAVVGQVLAAEEAGARGGAGVGVGVVAGEFEAFVDEALACGEGEAGGDPVALAFFVAEQEEDVGAGVGAVAVRHVRSPSEGVRGGSGAL